MVESNVGFHIEGRGGLEFPPPPPPRNLEIEYGYYCGAISYLILHVTAHKLVYVCVIKMLFENFVPD